MQAGPNADSAWAETLSFALGAWSYEHDSSFNGGVGRRGTLGSVPKIYFTLVFFHTWGCLGYSKSFRDAKKFKELESISLVCYFLAKK